MKTKLLLLTALLGFITVSCEQEVGVYYDFDEDAFHFNREGWEQLNIQNYQFDQFYMSSATGPVYETIVVRDGIATTNAGIDQGSAIIGDIPAIYDRILTDFNEVKQQEVLPIYGITVDIKYNEEYHFPEEVDFSTTYKTTVDGGAWYDIKITNFEILAE